MAYSRKHKFTAGAFFSDLEALLVKRCKKMFAAWCCHVFFFKFVVPVWQVEEILNVKFLFSSRRVLESHT